jgi:ribosomal protein L19E
VLVCIGVVDVDVDELETGVVDQAAPRGVREDAEEVVVVLDAQRLSRLAMRSRSQRCSRDPTTQRGSRRSPQRARSNGDARKASSATPSSSRAA